MKGKSIKQNLLMTCPPTHTGYLPPPECLSVKVYERIKFLRQSKNWSQEETAHRLNMSINGYARIERGETDLPLSRLEQIAETFGVELSEFFGVNEKMVFNLAGKQNDQSHWYINPATPQIELIHELEKAQMIIERQTQEIAYLKQIVNLLNTRQE